jgi:hypothetical protein
MEIVGWRSTLNRQKAGEMAGIADVLSSQMVKDQYMTQAKYDELIIAKNKLNDLQDLICIKIKSGKGLLFDELKVIYDLQIASVESEDSND